MCACEPSATTSAMTALGASRAAGLSSRAKNSIRTAPAHGRSHGERHQARRAGLVPVDEGSATTLDHISRGPSLASATHGSSPDRRLRYRFRRTGIGERLNRLDEAVELIWTTRGREERVGPRLPTPRTCGNDPRPVRDRLPILMSERRTEMRVRCDDCYCAKHCCGARLSRRSFGCIGAARRGQRRPPVPPHFVAAGPVHAMMRPPKSSSPRSRRT